MKTYGKSVLIILLALFLLIGCNKVQMTNKEIISENNKEIQNNNEVVHESVYESVYKDDDKNPLLGENNSTNADEKENYNNVEENEKNEPEEINLKGIKPNEAGQIMIIMYHSLGEEEKTYVRSVENFKEDLELLYNKGYRLISLKDFITNNINVEAGKTPVILTFDDGNKTDFNIIEQNGKKNIDSNSVVGILEDFYERHPDFGLEATFFIYGEKPFRQSNLIEYKLNYIVDKGMDIGNHTYRHDKLSVLSEGEIQKTLAENVAFIKKYLPDYEVSILSLPYGARPKSEEKRKYLYKGVYDGIEYNNIGALAVGWRPEYSPIHKEFDSKYIHRVHGSSEKFGIRYWLDYFDRHPEKRYISDGDKNTITVPENLINDVDKDKISEKKLVTYTINESE